MQKTEVGTRASYPLYKQISEAPIDIKTYLLIGEAYRNFMLEKVLEGEEVTLPARLGTLSIIGTKKKIRYDKKGVPLLPPDWKKTKELWDKDPEAKLTKKRVFCLNEHTGGISYKFHWSKNRVPIENKTVYALRLIRKHKRAVYTAVTINKKEFYTKST